MNPAYIPQQVKVSSSQPPSGGLLMRMIRKVQTRIADLPFAVKLIAVNMLLIALPLFVLIPLTNQRVAALSQAELRKNSIETVQQISKNISVLFDNLNAPMNVLITDEDVQQGLLYPAEGYEVEKINQYTAVQSYMSSLFTSSYDYTSILIYGLNGEIYHRGFDIKDYTYDFSTMFQALEDQRYIETHVRDYAIQKDPVISILRPIRSLADHRLLGYMIVDIDYEYLDQLIFSSRSSENRNIMIVHGDHVLYSQDEQHLDSTLDADICRQLRTASSGNVTFHVNHEQRYYSYAAISGTDWIVVAEHSLWSYTQETGRVIRATLLTALLLLFVSALLLVLMSSAITRPLRKLTSLMEAAQGGDYTVRFHSKYHDEIGQLGNTFNYMLSNMNSLIENVYQLQLAEKNATIYALQTQINPHFLYNTLQMISDFASVSDGDEVSAICGRLSSIFRYSLESADKYVFFSDELTHVQNYIYIQSIRMNHRFTFVTEIPESCSNVYTPRLILQPIVENAVTHGIYSKMEGARIAVSAEIADHTLHVKVTDNGVGMSKETLEALQKKLDEGITAENLAADSIGLSNVHRRLILSYGREYGLTVNSAPDQGTAVSFRIPISSQPERRLHA